ncbi:hypothetical protein CN601_15140 [Bacillus sp. AFS017336]|nr:hypothetical protein CN692_00580 [Bacillus sp. AFS002410]PEL09872.1 hypothetical protein CN601_15140 [Bacillus sp. AFS017336]
MMTVLSMNYEPNLVSGGTDTAIVSTDSESPIFSDDGQTNGSFDGEIQLFNRWNRCFVDEPIHPKVEKNLFFRTK